MLTKVIEEQTLNRIAARITERKCILFLGAGVHYPPDSTSPYYDSYPPEARPPLGKALAHELANLSSFADLINSEDVGNLQRVSQHFESVNTRQVLVEHVYDRVSTGKKPSPVLRALAEMDFPLVITTNYDHLFEDALTLAGKKPAEVGIYDPKGTEFTQNFLQMPAAGEPPILFKMHGDISRPESIVITDEDYIKFVMRMGDKDDFHPIPRTIRQKFAEWPILFIGYSLLDYNLRLLFLTLRWKIDPANIPPLYSVDYRPDPLIFDVWHSQRRYVIFMYAGHAYVLGGVSPLRWREP